ncbi:methyltransferase [Flavobacteriaceae bacterium R38]|nr:methyltransferase [Flavobacteriaceae bacterium R38]
MRKIKRSGSFEMTLVINDENFINPPKQAQRNAVVNRAVKEFTADLSALNEQTKRFVPGETVNTVNDRTQKVLTEQEIMEDWQIPVMEVMAKVITERGGDILEIGFGRGVSADMIQKHPIDSHTIIECNDAVVNDFHQWKNKYPNSNIEIVHSLWQDTIEDLGQFDGIFFHTYPLNEDEYMQYVNGSITFAQHFFAHAAAHLKPGGSFTYFSNEIDSVSREHQRELLSHFSSFSVQIVPLDMPEDVKDTWWADTIAVIKAVK